MTTKDVFKVCAEDIDYIAEGRAFILEKNGEIVSVSNIKQFNEMRNEGYSLIGYNIEGKNYQVGDLGMDFFEDKIFKMQNYNDEEDYFDDYDFYQKGFYEYDEENSLFWENDVREFLLDCGLPKKIVEKTLVSIHLEPQEGEKDFIIDYYQLRSILFTFNYKFPDVINSLAKFRLFLYPRVSEEYVEIHEFENTLKKFKFKEKEIKKIFNSLHISKDYLTKRVFFSKKELFQVMSEYGYSSLLCENVIYHPTQNHAMNEILALCFKNTGKMYSSTESLYSISDKLYQLIKIGPKNTKLIADKVKIMAEILEEMNKNNLSTFEYYTNKYPLLLEFIESITFQFNDGVDVEFKERHTDLIMTYQYIKKLISQKTMETYAKEQGIEIQKNENKKKKNKRINKKIKSLKFAFIKNSSTNRQKNTIKDFIGEKLNDLFAQSLSCAIYKKSKKYASIDVTKLTVNEINKWFVDNQRLMKRFEKYNNSKYCSVSLPFTADVNIMEYLFNINCSFEQISKVCPTFLLEKKELNSLDESSQNYIINYLALAQNQEQSLFESYESKKEINQYIKKGTRNRIVTILGGMVAAIALTSFSGMFSFKNHLKEKVNEIGITNDLDIESLKTTEIEEELSSKFDNNIKDHSGDFLYPGEVIIEGIVNEIEQVTEAEEENDIFHTMDNEMNNTYLGEVVIEGIVESQEENSIKEKSFISIGDSVDTVNNAKVYGNHTDLATHQNSMKSYYGSNDSINRTVRAVVLENSDHYVQVVYNNDEVKNFLGNDYDVIGYQIDNMYSFDENGIYTNSEGIYNDEDVMKLVLKK